MSGIIECNVRRWTKPTARIRPPATLRPHQTGSNFLHSLHAFLFFFLYISSYSILLPHLSLFNDQSQNLFSHFSFLFIIYLFFLIFFSFPPLLTSRYAVLHISCINSLDTGRIMISHQWMLRNPNPYTNSLIDKSGGNFSHTRYITSRHHIRHVRRMKSYINQLISFQPDFA